MELLIAVAALAFGVAALVLALTLRSRLDALDRAASSSKTFEGDMRHAHEAMHGEISELRRLLSQTRRELDQERQRLETAQRELGELKAAADVLPAPPPLPKSRTARLDDLRQQLRAAHAEPDDSDQV
jgi:hypothetical protein